MKVIELLNKIANGEEVPKKVKYHNRIYIKRSDCYNYILENGGFDDELKVIVECLNDEVEIIEEDKKIKKIDLKKKKDGFLYLNGNKIVNQDFTFALKINEIIDKINGMEDR